VQDVAVQHRYDVMIANTDPTRDKEQLFFESVLRRPVDGAIVVPYYLTAEDLDNLMVRTGASVAAVGKHIDHPRIDLTYPDDDRASYGPDRVADPRSGTSTDRHDLRRSQLSRHHRPARCLPPGACGRRSVRSARVRGGG
jgi:hypothetical protein